MIQRSGIVLLFAFLGIGSLLLVDSLLTWLCAYMPGLCRRYSGPCPGIDVCTPDAMMSLVLSAVYFGPSIAFGAAGYFFSKQPRNIVSWVVLLVGLVVVHSVFMFTVMQISGT